MLLYVICQCGAERHQTTYLLEYFRMNRVHSYSEKYNSRPYFSELYLSRCSCFMTIIKVQARVFCRDIYIYITSINITLLEYHHGHVG